MSLAASGRGIAQLDGPAPVEVFGPEPHHEVGRCDIRNDRINLVIQIDPITLSALGEVKRHSAFTMRRSSAGVLHLNAIQPLAVVEHQVIPTVACWPTGDSAFLNTVLQHAEQRQLALL
jgi:hypothetical protein